MMFHLITGIDLVAVPVGMVQVFPSHLDNVSNNKYVLTLGYVVILCVLDCL
jgi:hypothetical protein